MSNSKFLAYISGFKVDPYAEVCISSNVCHITTIKPLLVAFPEAVFLSFLVLLEAGDLKLTIKGKSLYEFQTLDVVRKSEKQRTEFI